MSADERLVERVLYDLAQGQSRLHALTLAEAVCAKAGIGQDSPRRRLATRSYATMAAVHHGRAQSGEGSRRRPRSQSRLLSAADKVRVYELATTAAARFQFLLRAVGAPIGASLDTADILALVERPEEPVTFAPRLRLSPLAARAAV